MLPLTEAIEDALTFQPWRGRQAFRLWGLLHMLRFNADAFCQICAGLARTAVVPFPDDIPTDKPLPDSLKQFLTGQVQTIRGWCEKVDLAMALLYIDKHVLNRLSPTSGSITIDEFRDLFPELERRIRDELSLRTFYYVPSSKADYFVGGQHPFGDVVADKFPSTAYDAAEASRCYALSRDTACVFHLMRVLEIGLAALAKPFNVSCEHRNWEQVIKDIENAVANIDKGPNKPANWRDDREFYSQCISYLRVTKDAWRNYTAHVRAKYDETEADIMMTNVKGFLQKLATRLSEQP